MQRPEHRKGRLAKWVRGMLMRRHSNIIACTLANKLGRMALVLAKQHARFDADMSMRVA